MTTLPVPPPQRAGDGTKPLTPEEWFARAWDVAEEVHGYCLHSRVHMQVLEHVLKPLATVLTFFDEHHVAIPPAVANSFARVRVLVSAHVYVYGRERHGWAADRAGGACV